MSGLSTSSTNSSTTVTAAETSGANDPRYGILDIYQKQRVDWIMNTRMIFHSKRNPQSHLTVTVHEIIKDIWRVFENSETCRIYEVRLVGGAASYAVYEGYRYNDVDLVFPVKVADEFTNKEVFHEIKWRFFALMEELVKSRMFSPNPHFEVFDNFLAKTFLFNPALHSPHQTTDAWSLFALNNMYGNHIELKFEVEIARKYQFVTDSFSINLSPYFYRMQPVNSTFSFWTNFGNDVKMAVALLHCRKIATENIHEISGGGYLKYVHLLCIRYTELKTDGREIAADITEMLEGFFLQWHHELNPRGRQPNPTANPIRRYLSNHFNAGATNQKRRFLKRIASHLGLIVSSENRNMLTRVVQSLLAEVDRSGSNYGNRPRISNGYI